MTHRPLVRSTRPSCLSRSYAYHRVLLLSKIIILLITTETSQHEQRGWAIAV